MFLSVAHAGVVRPQSSSKLLRERGLPTATCFTRQMDADGVLTWKTVKCRLHGTFFFDEQRGVGKARKLFQCPGKIASFHTWLILERSE